MTAIPEPPVFPPPRRIPPELIERLHRFVNVEITDPRQRASLDAAMVRWKQDGFGGRCACCGRPG